MQNFPDKAISAPPATSEVILTPKWLYCLLTLTIVAIVTMIVDIHLRSYHQDAAAVDQTAALGVFRLAMAPDDLSLNDPALNHPGVDLRFSPELPHPYDPTRRYLDPPKLAPAPGI